MKTQKALARLRPSIAVTPAGGATALAIFLASGFLTDYLMLLTEAATHNGGAAGIPARARRSNRHDSIAKEKARREGRAFGSRACCRKLRRNVADYVERIYVI